MDEIDKKWENLSEKEKEKWDRKALDINNLGLIVVMGRLAEAKKCYMCGRKFSEGLLTKNYKVKSWSDVFGLINVKFLLHLQETHGLFPELYEMILNKQINEINVETSTK
jgi:hypothetical protein